MNKIYELKNSRAELIKNAEAQLGTKNMEEHAKTMVEVKNINAEISAHEELLVEKGKFSEKDEHLMNLQQKKEKEKEDTVLKNTLNEARTGNDYANAWALALKNKVSPDMAKSNAAYEPLLNALTIGGGTPEGEDGGFLVPIDFDNMIHAKMKEMPRLSDYFNRENVTTTTGWRAYEKNASTTPLPEIGEMVPMETAQLKFEKVEYKVKKYGDFIAVSNELLADNTAGLMAYLSNWFAPRVVATENKLLLELLKILTAIGLTAGKEIAEIKRLFNKGINTAHSKNAILLTNQSGYDVLDQATDTNGRGLLVPDPTQPDIYRFKQRRIVHGDDDLIPNAGGKIPLFVGDMKAYATLFMRNPLEFATTNVGGDAWRTVSNEVRGIARMDAKVTDKLAALHRNIDEATTFAAPFASPFGMPLESAMVEQSLKIDDESMKVFAETLAEALKPVETPEAPLTPEAPKTKK